MGFAECAKELNKINGGGAVVEIELERYTELVKKEALFDLYMRDKEFNVYVFQRLEEKENA